LLFWEAAIAAELVVVECSVYEGGCAEDNVKIVALRRKA
jgi:hypothetical protein